MKPNRLPPSIVASLIVAVGGWAMAQNPAQSQTSTTAPKVGKVAGPKPLPMYSRVDAIDKANRTFTHKTAKGEVKHVVPASAEIKNGDAPARFDAIKVGDMVSGLRVRKSATEFEVVKITKFGPAARKSPEKRAEKKPSAEKKAP